MAKDRNALSPKFAEIMSAHITYCNSAHATPAYCAAFHKRRRLLASLTRREQQLFAVTCSALMRIAFLGGDETC